MEDLCAGLVRRRSGAPGRRMKLPDPDFGLSASRGSEQGVGWSWTTGAPGCFPRGRAKTGTLHRGAKGGVPTRFKAGRDFKASLATALRSLIGTFLNTSDVRWLLAAVMQS